MEVIDIERQANERSLKSPINYRTVYSIVIQFTVTCIKILPVKQGLQLLQFLKAKNDCIRRMFVLPQPRSALHIALCAYKASTANAASNCTRQFSFPDVNDLVLILPWVSQKHLNSEFLSMWCCFLTLGNYLNIFLVILELVLAFSWIYTHWPEFNNLRDIKSLHRAQELQSALPDMQKPG